MGVDHDKPLDWSKLEEGFADQVLGLRVSVRQFHEQLSTESAGAGVRRGIEGFINGLETTVGQVGS